MAGIALLVVLVVIPLVLFLGRFCNIFPTRPLINFWLVYLALSSCLGDSLRRGRSGSTHFGQQTSFDRGYVMNLSSGAGQAGWEQIEMENMLNHEDEGSEIRDLRRDTREFGH